jgi:ABC-type uncharacterized transport system permease subunit
MFTWLLFIVSSVTIDGLLAVIAVSDTVVEVSQPSKVKKIVQPIILIFNEFIGYPLALYDPQILRLNIT